MISTITTWPTASEVTATQIVVDHRPIRDAGAVGSPRSAKARGSGRSRMATMARAMAPAATASR